MTHAPSVGANNYRDAVRRGRGAVQTIRQALRRIVEEAPGPQTTAMLLAKAGLTLAELNEILDEFDQIGQRARNLEK